MSLKMGCSRFGISEIRTLPAETSKMISTTSLQKAYVFVLVRCFNKGKIKYVTKSFHSLPEDCFNSGPLSELTRTPYIRRCKIIGVYVFFRDLVEIWPPLISIKGKPYSKLTTKSIRAMIIKTGIPKNQITWHQSLPLDFNWSPVWKNVWKVPCPQKWIQTYFLLLHRGLPHGERAFNYDLDYPSYYHCPLCPTHLESLTHIFLKCEIAQHLWNWLRRTWKNATGAAPPVNLTFVISGGAFRVSKSHSQNLLNPILKFFHRAIIHSLWIARCDLHHGKLVSLAGVLTAMLERIKQCLSLLYLSKNSQYLILHSPPL